MTDHHRLPLAPRVAGHATREQEGQSEQEAAHKDASVRSLDDARRRRDMMQIGDIARETGKTVRAIHLYEELGLLRPAARSKGRFRLYARDALLRIRWIGQLQSLGFSLADIQAIVRQWEQLGSAPGAMRRMRDIYMRKLEETREQQRALAALENELIGSIAYLDTCEVCDPQRLLSACDCCDLHDKDTEVPELVLGFRAGSHLQPVEQS